MAEANAAGERGEAVVFGAPLIEQASIDEVVDTLRSGWIGAGPRVARFEQMLEAYLDVPHVVCVASGTAALYLALRCVDVGPGDEVLLPTMTFVACAQAIELTGATPVVVDSEADTNLISLELAERAITQRTRAILVVHLAGRPVDLRRLRRLSDERGLAVIEDATHALGARFDGRTIGSSENLTVFSFNPQKNITSIDGGAIATRDETVAARARQMARHGVDLSSWERYRDGRPGKYEVTSPGFKFGMTDVQAAVALHQLPRLDGWIASRARQWHAYDSALADLPVRTPAPTTGRMRHARHLYQVMVEDSSPLGRDELIASLQARNIGTGVHYRAIHLHSYFRDRYGLEPADFPVATEASARLMSLPIGPSLSGAGQARVIDALHTLLAGR
ncbi:MAG: DegT/DnrJ/EryC1/StrS family aminotransferase [Solirubrobacteraceae bacterium]|jgi:dTDP-4-amino-4,6-dideoxygalactose transaminase